MIVIDWSAVTLGLGIGAVASLLFFAGLSWGMRTALRMDNPVPALALSAALRIGALLAVGWGVAALSGPFALFGFALAFLTVRTLCIIGARWPRTDRGAP